MEAARQHKGAGNSDYTRRLSVPSLFHRAGEHRGPESILSQPRVASFDLEVLMLERLGRGVTRPLH